MIANISRFPRSLRNGYRQVLLQQGRVLLDADFNEQGTLGAHALRQLTEDLIGPHAGPVDELGFAITSTADGFAIARGRYYVRGLLAVNEAPESNSNSPLPFEAQEGVAEHEVDFQAGTQYFFYLDVWERAVSWLEDDSIREVALGGPDTAVRRQLVWRVRATEAVPTAAFTSEKKAVEWLSNNVERHPPVPGTGPPLHRLPLMRAFVDPEDDPDETPCVADPLGGYRGLENQLYRIQVHEADDGKASFKWSRENGSVMAGLAGHVANTLVVEGVRDVASGFAAGQWVEIVDRIAELRGVAGVMVQLTKVEREHLTYDPDSASSPVPPLETLVSPIVRRWDQSAREGQHFEGGAIHIEEDRDYELERGIKVSFPKQDPAVKGERRYAVGDWWGFAARVATADIDWPTEVKTVGGISQKMYLARSPDGVEHVYAPLGVGKVDDSVKSMQREIITLWKAV